MGLGIPPLRIKMMLKSNLLKSIMLVRRLAVPREKAAVAAALATAAAGRPILTQIHVLVSHHVVLIIS